MLAIKGSSVDEETISFLSDMQRILETIGDYPSQVASAKTTWNDRNSTARGKRAFRAIRDALAAMCVGSQRCAYCEDSAADEIEHIRPKSLFPEITFVWENYLFACGPCNGPKSSRYGFVSGARVEEFVPGRRAPLVRPPAGQSALVDPRQEDPLCFLELDVGGTTSDGVELKPTFNFLPAVGLGDIDRQRAEFTISVLNLNREVIRAALENAFSGFRARLVEYVVQKENETAEEILLYSRNDILRTPHLTVFAEMRRQSQWLPEIGALFERAPEALEWPLVPEA